jgi:hypothetical protein
MSGLRLDMPGLDWICPVWGSDMSGHQKLQIAEK